MPMAPLPNSLVDGARAPRRGRASEVVAKTEATVADRSLEEDTDT
jgi:hypothetical protein